MSAASVNLETKSLPRAVLAARGASGPVSSYAPDTGRTIREGSRISSPDDSVPASLQIKSLARTARRAAICEEFLRLTREEHLPLTAAARAMHLSPALFSGAGSMLQRYLRGGIAGIEPIPGGGAEACDLSRRIEGLGWFIPAASFFYFSAHRRLGALGMAVARAAALPKLPLGWRKDTRERFLKRIRLPEVPECPQWLRDELCERERHRRPAVPERIARLITASPSELRRHVFEVRSAELPSFPFGVLAKRLAQTRAEGVCRITIECLQPCRNLRGIKPKTESQRA